MAKKHKLPDEDLQPEEAAVLEEVQPNAEPSLEAAEVPETLGTLGVHRIPVVNKTIKVVNGVPYVEVLLADGATYLLSESDFKAQHQA